MTEQNEFNVSEARTFLTPFVSDPKLLENMDETGLKGYHERVNQTIDKVRPKNGNWPDNWRDLYAGTDEKKKGMLSRFAAPTNAFDALISAQQKISEAGLKTPFPDKGLPEEQKAWRESNGIPESFDKYDLKFDNGLVIGDEDKPRIDEFLKIAHGMNLPPTAVKSLVQWNYGMLKKESEELADADKTLAISSQESLRAEWGADYRQNMNKVYGLLDTAPEEVRDSLKGARLADGTPLLASSAAIKYLANLALEINPATTLVPNNSGDMGKAVNDEIANIEKSMANRSGDYWKGPKAEGLQDRYRQLVEARDKLQKKGKAA